METNQQKSIFELTLTEGGRSNLTSIAQWAYISAVVGFVSLGVTVLGAVKEGSFFSILISAVVSLLLNITLLNAASSLKKGLALSDQGHFNNGLLKLTTYFRIIGILMIIFLVIFVLAMLVVLLAGSARRF